jgi:hypothetical protein
MPTGLSPNVFQDLLCWCFNRPGFLFHLRFLQLR